MLVIDASTPDKPRSKHIESVGRHRSGNHRAVVSGITLVTLLWSAGDRPDRTDSRVSHTATDGKAKNDHFAAVLAAAHARGFRPKAVPLDGRYASVDSLKRVRGFGWVLVTPLSSNRKVWIAHGPSAPVSDQPIAAAGAETWPPEFGSAWEFRVVAPNGDTTHRATNDLGMAEDARRVFAELSRGSRSTTGGGGGEAVHRGGAESGAGRTRAADPHRVHLPGVRAAGVPPVHPPGGWFAAEWDVVRRRSASASPTRRTSCPTDELRNSYPSCRTGARPQQVVSWRNSRYGW